MLRLKPFDEHYTRRNFDRVFIEAPYEWRHMKKQRWDWVLTKAQQRRYV